MTQQSIISAHQISGFLARFVYILYFWFWMSSLAYFMPRDWFFFKCCLPVSSWFLECGETLYVHRASVIKYSFNDWWIEPYFLCFQFHWCVEVANVHCIYLQLVDIADCFTGCSSRRWVYIWWRPSNHMAICRAWRYPDKRDFPHAADRVAQPFEDWLPWNRYFGMFYFVDVDFDLVEDDSVPYFALYTGYYEWVKNKDGNHVEHGSWFLRIMCPGRHIHDMCLIPYGSPKDCL